MNGWQPIESAPRDGSRILIFYPLTQTRSGNSGRPWRTEDPIVLVGFWREALSRENGGYFTSDYREGKLRQATATHWMPLPAAPDAA